MGLASSHGGASALRFKLVTLDIVLGVAVIEICSCSRPTVYNTVNPIIKN